MPDNPWFQLNESGKRYTPASWQGWLVTLIGAVVSVIVTYVIVVILIVVFLFLLLFLYLYVSIWWSGEPWRG